MDLNIRCERCPLTFVSRVNYNRHRVEHPKQTKAIRSTSTQEELVQTREKLAKFWNTLNVEEQKEVLSVEGGVIVAGAKVTGPVIKKSLENFAKKFLVLGLLQIPDSEKNYYMTVSPLLDIVKAAPSRFPISVEDLSSILNNGSEGTFLLGEVSSVEKAMFDKEDGSLDVVASICFILEKQLLKKECEYSKLQMQLLEEIANEQAQQLIKEEAALKRDQEKKKKKKKKKGQQGSNVETPATLPIEGAGEIVVDDEPAGEAALKSDQEKTKKKGQIESNIETPQTEPVIESSQTTESTSETCILVGPSNTTHEVDETSNEFWYKVVEGGRTMLDEVGVMPICALYTIKILSQMLREISVWDGDRFHIVYQKMLRDIILIIVRLEREGIRTGTLGDEDIQIIFGDKLVEQQTRVLNNIEVKTDSKLLRGEFINLVVRLKQQREGVKEIPEELTCFLELISLQSRWNFFELLVHHPWLMSVMERFYFPYRCWVQMQLVYNYPWEPKFRSMTPSDFDLESEVNKMEDCFKRIYNNEIYNHKEKRKEKIQYENNYVGLLLFCKNVIVHFNKDSMTSESVQKRVNDFLGNHFPYLWLALFQFFVSEDISLNFKFANEEEFIKMSEEPEYRCFIGDLAWSTSDRSLKKAFDKHGKVVEAKVVVDKLSGRSRGYGFITFADKKAMEEAIEQMNGIDLDGRTITVEKAQPHQGSGRDYDGARSHDLDRGRDYGGGRGSDGGGVCFNCGKPGHFARECPSREVSRGGGSRYGDRDEKFSGGGGGGCGSRYGDRYSGCSRDSGSGDRSSSGSDRFRCDRSGPYERRGRGGYRSE